MKIILAKSSGFCTGVKRAYDLTLKAKKNSDRVYTYGPLVHNSQVIEQLKDNGIYTIDNIDEIKDGTLVIRSHGISPTEYLQIEEQGLKVVDGTCPLVIKIHRLVNDYNEKGYQIVIAGDKNHPEVKGIIGWAKSQAITIENPDDVNKIHYNEKILLVCQTTFLREKWEKITERFREVFPEGIIIDTICHATKTRQRETEEIAKKSDMLIVIGGKESSNTKKLFEIGQKYTESHWIQTAEDLNPKWFINKNTIGITAGASTPQWIIKEVVCKMEEFVNKNGENVEGIENQDFTEDYEKTFVKLKAGEIVKGTVIKVTEDEVMVNIGYKADGIIPSNELSYVQKESPIESIKVGDIIDVYVIKVDDGEGNVILSKRKADSEKAWAVAEEALANKSNVSVKIIEEVKGGVIADFYGLKAFMPASHVDMFFVPDLKVYLNQTVDVKVIEIDKKKNRIVVSRKSALEETIEAKKKETWDKIEEGQVLDGIVRRITDFGVFVDIGGVDGLIHISELSWGRVNHPNEVVSEGEPVKVKILKLDKDKDRISLGLKQVIPNPWDTIHERFKVNGVYEGKVARIVNFGAFIELEPGVEGLVHISQVSKEHIEKVEDVLKVGQRVKVKILDINSVDHKMSLSIKDAEEHPKKQEKAAQEDTGSGVTLGEMFKDLFEEKGQFED